MKSKLSNLLFLMMLMPLVILAQETEPEAITQSAGFFKIVLGFLEGVGVYLLAESGKHLFSGNFSISTFFKSNIKPIIWSVIGGVVLAAIYSFLPQILPFIQTQIGTEVNVLDWSALLLTGGSIGAIIKGLTKKE